MIKAWLSVVLINTFSGVVLAIPNAAMPPESAAEQHQIFQSLYYSGDRSFESSVPSLSLKKFKEQLKSTLALNLNSHLQIGVDTVKAKTLKAQESEIVVLEPHLAPRLSQNGNAKGYGVEVKFKLD